MKLFRKLAVNINSHVESMADRFENREALSKAYIQEYERVVAQAKVRLNQVHGEVKRLEESAGKQQEQIRLWTERARRVHSTDEHKALECVARMTECQEKLAQLEKSLQETKALKTKMASDLETIVQKLETLKRKQQSLASRQICAQAVQRVEHNDGGLCRDLDDLFSRWETDIIADELHAQAAPPEGDTFADEFESDEKQQALRQTLDTLLAQPSDNKEEK